MQNTDQASCATRHCANSTVTDPQYIEEVELIDRGLLDFERAQWIKSEDQRAAIKNTIGSMVCQACGTSFASNRLDSIERHVRKGAWYVILWVALRFLALKLVCSSARAQEKRREKSEHNATIHRKKGGKTSAGHTRR